MDSREFNFISEDFFSDHATPVEMDLLLADGWRHFGRYFFRYSVAFHRNRYRFVIPLRIRLEKFALSKSLRRVIRLNEDLKTVIRPATIDEEKGQLFERHRMRFVLGRPESLEHFIDRDASRIPCRGMEVCVYGRSGQLLAASFFDDAATSISAVYAIFDPAESKRSLGIYTLLKEAEYARSLGKEFHYLGYAYEGRSFYDYKKRFRGTERFDWRGNWSVFQMDA
jgi:arginyl-tRNA--protein-N-Asp/Glu arginylyltransferase